MGNSCTHTQKSTIIIPSKVIQVQRKSITDKTLKPNTLATGVTPTSGNRTDFQTRPSSTDKTPKIEFKPPPEDEETKGNSTFRLLHLKYDLSQLAIGEHYLEKELADVFAKLPESKKKKILECNLKWDRVIVDLRDKFSEVSQTNTLYTCNDLCLRDFAISKSKSYRKMVLRSIPARYRWSIWKNHAEVDKYYVKDLYEKLRGLSTKWETDIKKDLHRTFPNEPYFSAEKFDKIGQTHLSNVLKALSIYFPNFGYAQSVNFLVGFLLIISGGNELESFWMFVALARDHRFLIMGLFEKGFPLLEFYTYLFYEILQEEAPQLYEHIKQQQLPDPLWLFKWFWTMFLYSLPPKYTIRIWDFVLVHGLFSLIQISVAIVKFLKDDIMNLDTIGMDFLFKFLKGEPPKIKSQNMQENSEVSNLDSNRSPIMHKKGTIIVNHLSMADVDKNFNFQNVSDTSDIKYNFKEFDIEEVLDSANKILLDPEKISVLTSQYTAKTQKVLPEIYSKLFTEWPMYAEKNFKDFQTEINFHILKCELSGESIQPDGDKPVNEVVVSVLDEDEINILRVTNY